jgi:hypothetical protein
MTGTVSTDNTRSAPATQAADVLAGISPVPPRRHDPRFCPDAWVDTDGTIYTGDGPYAHRPERVLRRKISHAITVLARWWWSLS